MLNNILDKSFNSTFHHYFDRDDNFNCYVSFNFIEFMKYNSQYPQIYNDENLVSKILDLLQFRFFLQNTDFTNILEIKEVSKIDLFSNNNLTTFFIKHDSKKIRGDYQLRCQINFEDQFYNWSTNTSVTEASKYFNLTEYQYVVFIKDARQIIETKFTTQFKPSNLARTYEFFSDFIKFKDKQVKASNLYDIYKQKISYQEYVNFINNKEIEKQATYYSNLPLIKYIKDGLEYDLKFDLKNKTGDVKNYLDLTLSLLSDSKNRDDYKKTSSLNNIYIKNLMSNRKVESVKTYEYISAIQSTACETDIYSNISTESFKDSDILYVATFFDNYDFIQVNDLWENEYRNIPVYILDIATKYNVYYLEKIEEKSLYEKWNLLTKDALNVLSTGTYLCMISSDRDFINNNIMENYFLLEK